MARGLQGGHDIHHQEQDRDAGRRGSIRSLTWAVNPIFLNDEVARSRGLGGKVAPGALTLSYAIDLLYQTGVFDHSTTYRPSRVSQMSSSGHP